MSRIAIRKQLLIDCSSVEVVGTIYGLRAQAYEMVGLGK